MQTEKLRQRFEHAESTIAELARTCASHKDVPDSLKQSIQQLDDQARIPSRRSWHGHVRSLDLH